LTPVQLAGRIVGVYAELPARLARCRSPFELLLEQWLIGPRLLAAFQQDPDATISRDRKTGGRPA
jgi:hypothetical protein